MGRPYRSNRCALLVPTVTEFDLFIALSPSVLIICGSKLEGWPVDLAFLSLDFILGSGESISSSSLAFTSSKTLSRSYIALPPAAEAFVVCFIMTCVILST